jgi:TorA maturation chaperone TorD
VSRSSDGEERSVGGEVPPDDRSMADARGRVYGLLAATFDGEATTVARALEAGTYVTLADAFPVSVNTDALCGFGAGDAVDADALAIGYDNLFVVPGDHYVPPFASAHAVDPSETFESDSRHHTAGEAGELLGDPAAEMARLYAAAGFEPERGDGIPDHLAAQFEFMRALCEREATMLDDEPDDTTDTEGLDRVRALQAHTLAQLGWLDQFETTVSTRDTVEGVFAALARLARTFAAWDARDGVRADPPTAVDVTTD